METLTIAQAVPTEWPPQEGMAVYVAGLSQYLVSLGHSVGVWARQGFAGTPQENPPFEVRALKTAKRYPVQGFMFANAVQRDLSSMSAIPWDLIHQHSPLIGPVKLGLPIVSTIHTPIAVDVLHYEVGGVYQLLSRMQAPFSWYTESALVRASRQVTAVSACAARDFVLSHPRVKAPAVIGNAVDTDVFRPDESVRADPPVVLFKGRLAPRKGVFEFLRAARLLVLRGTRARFLISGSGPLAGRVREFVRIQHLGGSVDIGTYSPRSEVPKAYQKASVFVLPSHYEGLSTVLLEAMSSGLPVVASNIPANREVVREGREGTLVKPGDIQGYADAIERFVEDRDLAMKSGNLARSSIFGSHTWDVVGKRIVRIYNSWC